MRYLAMITVNIDNEKKYYAVYLLKIKTSLYKVIVGTNKNNYILTNMPITSIKEACQLIHKRFSIYLDIEILFKKRFAKHIEG